MTTTGDTARPTMIMLAEDIDGFELFGITPRRRPTVPRMTLFQPTAPQIDATTTAPERQADHDQAEGGSR